MSFKIGDKVRLIEDYGNYKTGSIHTVTHVYNDIVNTDTGLGVWHYRLELVPVDTEQSIATGVFVLVANRDTIEWVFPTALDALKAANKEEYYTAHFIPFGAYKSWEDIK